MSPFPPHDVPFPALSLGGTVRWGKITPQRRYRIEVASPVSGDVTHRQRQNRVWDVIAAPPDRETALDLTMTVPSALANFVEVRTLGEPEAAEGNWAVGTAYDSLFCSLGVVTPGSETLVRLRHNLLSSPMSILVNYKDDDALADSLSLAREDFKIEEDTRNAILRRQQFVVGLLALLGTILIQLLPARFPNGLVTWISFVVVLLSLIFLMLAVWQVIKSVWPDEYVKPQSYYSTLKWEAGKIDEDSKTYEREQVAQVVQRRSTERLLLDYSAAAADNRACNIKRTVALAWAMRWIIVGGSTIFLAALAAGSSESYSESNMADDKKNPSKDYDLSPDEGPPRPDTIGSGVKEDRVRGDASKSSTGESDKTHSSSKNNREKAIRED